ncbi:Endothelin-converting enzyme 2 [Entophlyctis luteolus]|nr:Endothelin-converting enzyme 2 [Entophlyctis luteolus]
MACDILKAVTVRAWKDAESRQNIQWIDCELKDSAWPQTIWNIFKRIVIKTEYWDHLTSELTDFGFHLIETSQSGSSSPPKLLSSAAPHKWCLYDLGSSVLYSLAFLHQNTAQAIFDTIIGRIRSRATALASYSPIIESIVACHPTLLQRMSPHIMDILLALNNSIPSTRERFLWAIGNFFCVKDSVSADFIIPLRKGMFHSELDSRKVAMETLLHSLKLMDAPEESSSQGITTGCQGSEILFILRRGLNQQQEIRLQLYEGFFNALQVQPWIAGSCLDLLRPHFARYYVDTSAVAAPLRLDLCFNDNSLLEPLPQLLLLAIECIRKSNDSNGASEFAAQFDDLIDRLAKADIADFDVNKDADFTSECDESKKNRSMVDLLIGIYEVAVEYVLNSDFTHQIMLDALAVAQKAMSDYDPTGKTRKYLTSLASILFSNVIKSMPDLNTLPAKSIERALFSTSVECFEKVFAFLAEKTRSSEMSLTFILTKIVDGVDDVDPEDSLVENSDDSTRTGTVELIDLFLTDLKPKQIIRDIRRSVGSLVEEDEVDDLDEFGDKDVHFIIIDILTVLNENVEQVRWVASKLKNLKEDNTKLLVEAKICKHFMGIASFLHEILQANLPFETSDSLFTTLIHTFKAANDVLKHKIAFPEVSQQFDSLVHVLSECLRDMLNEVIPIMQERESENSIIENTTKKGAALLFKKRKRTSRESKTMPALIFEMEQFDRYLISLHKKAGMNMMRHVKRSTAHDFRIMEQRRSIHCMLDSFIESEPRPTVQAHAVANAQSSSSGINAVEIESLIDEEDELLSSSSSASAPPRAFKSHGERTVLMDDGETLYPVIGGNSPLAAFKPIRSWANAAKAAIRNHAFGSAEREPILPGSFPGGQATNQARPPSLTEWIRDKWSLARSQLVSSRQQAGAFWESIASYTSARFTSDQRKYLIFLVAFLFVVYLLGLVAVFNPPQTNPPVITPPPDSNLPLPPPTNPVPPPPVLEPSVLCTTKSCVLAAANILTAIDASADPCDDFYRFSCGNWIKNHPKRSSKLERQSVIDEMSDKNNDIILSYLNQAGFPSPNDKKSREVFLKMKTVFNSCVKSGFDNQLTAQLADVVSSKIVAKTPIVVSTFPGGSPQLRANILVEIIASTHEIGASGLFAIGVTPDPENPEIRIPSIVPAEESLLGLRARELYFNANTLIVYKQAVADGLGSVFGGLRNWKDIADQIVEFEKTLAQILPNRSTPFTEADTVISLKDLQSAAPFISWTYFFHLSLSTKLSPNTKIFLPMGLSYFERLSELILGLKDTIAIDNYFAWISIWRWAKYGGRDFRDSVSQIHVLFSGSKDLDYDTPDKINGVCVEGLTEAMSDAVTRWYIEQAYSENVQTLAQAMMNGIRNSFHIALPSYNWLDMKTILEAEKKLAAMIISHGYDPSILNPEKLAYRYSPLEPRIDKFMTNIIAAKMISVKYVLGRIDEPVDRREACSPSTAVTSKYYSKFSVSGPNGTLELVDGLRTLGENIADNGGVARAFEAWRSERAGEGGGKKNAKLPGLDEYSEEQLFFIGYGQHWCENRQPEALLSRLFTDSHSPAEWRVNGVALNSQEFSKAFKCPVGSRMNPIEKCKIW